LSYHIWEVVEQDGCTRVFTQLIPFIYLPVKVLTRCYAIAGWEQGGEEGAIRIPTFYGANNHEIFNLFTAFGMCMHALSFANSHLIAWFYGTAFPSHRESFLWVLFTGALFFIPICALLCALLHHAEVWVTPKHHSFPLLLGLYIFARFFLLVLAFAAL